LLHPAVNPPAEVDRLVNENLRLARFFARRFAGFWGENEAFSIALAGLLEAAQVYDRRVGVKFGTFAGFRIRWKFSRELKRRKSLRRGGGATHVPLDAPIFADSPGGKTIADTVADPNAEPADEHAHRNDELARIPALLLRLDLRHRGVILARFGIGRPAETLETIGRRMGVTRERVRQIETEALASLNHLRRRAEVPELREKPISCAYLARHPSRLLAIREEVAA
jgi:RNA polymerase sigma factor (sigma-70 family)